MQKTLNIPVVELKNGREVASSTKSHEKTQTNENASKLRNLGKKRNLFFNANANKGRSR